MSRELDFYYGRLVKYLQMLALPAKEQRKIIEENISVSLAMEHNQMPRDNISFELMEMDEDLTIDVCLEELYNNGIITSDVKDRVFVVTELIGEKRYGGDKQVKKYAQLKADETIWLADAVEKHPFWKEQRKTAKKILDDLNEPLKVPIDLYIGLSDD
jgi:predicted transcriptional regulator